MLSQLFAFILSSFLFLGCSSYNLILWEKDFNLKWRHFKKEPPLKHEFEALTYGTIDTKVITNNYNYIIMEFNACFIKNSSWTKTKDNNELLRHEKIHFDIIELFARKMRKEFSQLKYVDIADFNKLYDETYYNLWKKHMNFQHLYDKETNHGKEKSIQEVWEKRIAKLLTDLNKYANRRTIIYRKK